MSKALCRATLLYSGDTRYFAVYSSPKEHLFVQMEKDAAWNSTVYIRFGAVPTTTVYDVKVTGTSDLQAEIPLTQEGVYYVMLETNYGMVGSFTVLAHSHPSVVEPDILYSYDTLGRLTGVTYPSGRKVTYIYDDRGNRIEYRVQQGCGGIWVATTTWTDPTWPR